MSESADYYDRESAEARGGREESGPETGLNAGREGVRRAEPGDPAHNRALILRVIEGLQAL